MLLGGKQAKIYGKSGGTVNWGKLNMLKHDIVGTQKGRLYVYIERHSKSRLGKSRDNCIKIFVQVSVKQDFK